LVGYDGERAEFLGQLDVSAAFRVFHQREDKTQPAVKQAEAAEAKPRPARDPDFDDPIGF